MTGNNSNADRGKSTLHPRNPHCSRYDFGQLIGACPELATYVITNPYNTQTIDFADPTAVKMLNRALLKQFYNIDSWEFPANYLCPPIPGRADYIHHAADLLARHNGGTIPTGSSVKVLDIGVGSNCIYPIIGHRAYGWHFVGSDIDPVAIQSAHHIVASNPSLSGVVECRLQSNPSNIFSNVVKPGEVFDLSICNPPFHDSAETAAEGTKRKTRNLSKGAQPNTALNFGGQNNELICQGGEAEFIRRMVKQSAELPHLCKWFTTLVSQKDNLYAINKSLTKVAAKEVHTISMAQGQKQSRLVAWTFFSEHVENEK